MAAVALAFFAGILIVVAPCSLPVLPAMLGVSLGQRDKARPAFITMGFVVSFTGAAFFSASPHKSQASTRRRCAPRPPSCWQRSRALMLWPRPFEWFWMRIGARLMPGDRMVMRFAQGNLGAFALGTALGLVWTPCAGPVLASILTLIATRDSLVSGAVLLLAYAVGAAVPLLAIGWGGQAVTTRVKVFARHSRRLQQGFGAVMIAFAIATYFDYDALIAAWLSQFYPGGQIGL